MASAPSVPANTSATSATSAPRAQTEHHGRWIPVALLAALAVSGIAAVALAGPSSGLDASMWLIAAAFLISIGIGVLWRQVSVAATRRSRPIAGPVHVSEPAIDSDRARLATLSALTEYAYWEQDPSGRYTRIDAPNANPYSPLQSLVGSQRGEFAGDWLEPTTTHHLESVVRKREDFRQIVWARTLPGGETLTFEESGQPRFNASGQFIGYQGVIREITERGSTSRPNQGLVNALSANPVPAVLLRACPRGSTTDRQWTVQWVNPAMIAMTGLAAENLRYQPLACWLEVEKANDNGDGQPLSQLLDSESNYRLGGKLTDRYGQDHLVTLTINKIEQTTAGTSTVVFVDHLSPALTRLKRETAEIQALRESEASKALELQVAARELESFSHTVSHDLGAPIRHVIGFSALLREQYGGLLDRVGNNSLERISAAGHRMESMLHALVDLHRISTTPVAADRLNLSVIARSVAQEIKQAQPDNTVTIDIEDGLTCLADRALMRMVLWNLINNAVKFSARSTAPRVTLGQVQQDGLTAFMVSDNGVGFDPESTDQLFRPFARLHSSTDYPGTGVGLATVQRIIRAHGGQIWAESEPGLGARFMFTLWDKR